VRNPGGEEDQERIGRRRAGNTSADETDLSVASILEVAAVGRSSWKHEPWRQGEDRSESRGPYSAGAAIVR